VLESATAPQLAGSPNRPQMLLLALLAAWRWEARSPSAGDVRPDAPQRGRGSHAGVPVLATVPRLHAAGAGRVLALPAMQGEQG